MSVAVQNATANIDRRLETGVLNPVTNGEIKAVVAEITGLKAADADRLIDDLAKSGKLGRVAGEIMDGSPLGLGGLSANERKAFFADMARKLDGQSLATLSDAFAGTDKRTGGFEPVSELGQAIATHGSPQAKLAYIAAQKSDVARGTIVDSGVGASTLRREDAEANAVGLVLGSMRGANAEAAFRAIGDKLPDVLASSIDARVTTNATAGVAVNVASWDAKAYGGIMEAAASTSNADLKAQIFDAGVGTLRSVRDVNDVIGGLTTVGKTQATRTMVDGLTQVINSNTTGVMRELTYNAETRDGSDFAAYAKEMLNQGRAAELGEQMGRLQVGNAGNENAVERLYRSEIVANTDQERLPNAGTLGYFVGSVHAAVKSIDADVAAERAMTTAVLKSALTVVDKAKVGGPAASAVGTTASVAKEWVQFAVSGAIRNESADAGIRLENAALPVDKRTRELGVGDAVVSAFEDTLATVARLAKP
ncbi:MULTISPECIES: hypothetical protein [unclassified Sphingomonas]|jgi:hypothetical protein|uniref:hypothetical protein n=1 Tax=unclassified Sphingomonas TaxID=196159 RepID=UPI00082E2FCE|nr:MULTISPECIES: hypothetical protein [unclassified Sphingomonas]